MASKKLKEAMEEIKAILKKHDIAGSIVLHTPGHSEFFLGLTPSYSCAWIEGDMLRLRAKRVDFNNSEERDKKIADTTNMLNLLSEVGGRNSFALMKVSEELDKITGSEHF